MTGTDDFLEHYGVKGMRWGVKRKSTHKESFDSKQVKKHRGKPAHALTNKQIKELNTRMKLEQEYRKMNPDKATRGQAHVKHVVATVGLISSVAGIMNTPVGRGLTSLGRSVINGSPSTSPDARAPSAFTGLLRDHPAPLHPDLASNEAFIRRLADSR